MRIKEEKTNTFIIKRLRTLYVIDGTEKSQILLIYDEHFPILTQAMRQMMGICIILILPRSLCVCVGLGVTITFIFILRPSLVINKLLLLNSRLGFEIKISFLRTD